MLLLFILLLPLLFKLFQFPGISPADYGPVILEYDGKPYIISNIGIFRTCLDSMFFILSLHYRPVWYFSRFRIKDCLKIICIIQIIQISSFWKPAVSTGNIHIFFPWNLQYTGNLTVKRGVAWIFHVRITKNLVWSMPGISYCDFRGIRQISGRSGT